MGKLSSFIVFVLVILGLTSYQNCSLEGSYGANKLASAIGAGGGNGDGYTGIFFALIENNACGTSNVRSLIRFAGGQSYLIKRDCLDITPQNISTEIEWIGEMEAIRYLGRTYIRDQSTAPTPTPGPTATPQVQTFALSCQPGSGTALVGFTVCTDTNRASARSSAESATGLKCVEVEKGAQFVCANNYNLTNGGKRFFPLGFNPLWPTNEFIKDYSTSLYEMQAYVSLIQTNSYDGMICSESVGSYSAGATGRIELISVSCRQNPMARGTGD